MSSSTTLDPVSFLFGQVLSQVDYLFESGYLSQENYSIIAGALIQTSPPSTPNARPAYPSYASSSQLTSEPSAYSTASYASGSGRPLPPLQTGSVPSATAPHHQQPAASPSTASQSSSKPSLLKFKGKSSKGKTTANEPPLPQAPFAEADEPQLGRVNRRLRGALQGGFVLSQIVDQALTLTPGVPEGLREKIVESVEEGSREYVQKATDPRNQALWRENALRAGSSAWKIARGGGGTSRASRSTASAGTVHEETGEYTLVRRDQHEASPASSSSVHSFFAAPNVNVTTVVTITFLEDLGKATSSEQAFAKDLPSPLEEGLPAVFSQAGSSGRPSVSGVPQVPGSLPSTHDPNFVSGRDW